MNLALSLWRIDARRAGAILELEPGWLALAVVLVLVPWATSTLRLWNWCRFLRTDIGLRSAFHAHLAGEVGAAVSPTAVGGAPFRIAALSERGLRLSRSTSISLLIAIEDLIFTAIALPVALVATGSRRLPLPESAGSGVPWNDAAPAAVVGIAVLAYFVQKRRGHGGLGVRMRLFWLDIRIVMRRVGHRGIGILAGNVLLSGLHWSARYSVIAALVAGLGIETDALRLIVLQWLCLTMMTLIPTPGAAGGAEATFLLLYGPLIPGDALAVTMAVWRFLTYYFLIGLALLLTLRDFDRRDFRRSVPGA